MAMNAGLKAYLEKKKSGVKVDIKNKVPEGMHMMPNGKLMKNSDMKKKIVRKGKK